MFEFLACSLNLPKSNYIFAYPNITVLIDLRCRPWLLTITIAASHGAQRPDCYKRSSGVLPTMAQRNRQKQTLQLIQQKGFVTIDDLVDH